MTPDIATELAREAVLVGLIVGLPVMLTAIVVGLAISIGQAVTQLQEQTLSFVPKIVGMFVVLVVLAPWMIDQMVDYSRELYLGVPERLTR